MQIIRGKKLKQIFSDHWQTFIQKHPGQIRSAIQKNVNKMLRCGTEDMGFHLYQCPNCHEEKKVPHTCKSRFCSACGVAQTKRCVVSPISWRVCIIKLAHDWLEKRFKAILEPSSSHVNWILRKFADVEEKLYG